MCPAVLVKGGHLNDDAADVARHGIRVNTVNPGPVSTDISPDVLNVVLDAGRRLGALLRGAPLAEAEGWLKERAEALGEGERSFVVAGLELRDRRAREREAQVRRELAGRGDAEDRGSMVDEPGGTRTLDPDGGRAAHLVLIAKLSRRPAKLSSSAHRPLQAPRASSAIATCWWNISRPNTASSAKIRSVV
jgi:hypothetical protein